MRALNEIARDIIHSGAKILTGHDLYMEQQAKCPDAMIVMRYYTEYKIIGSKADAAAELLEKILTHKHAGKMFVYDTQNYSYHVFSFGEHNLYKVVPELVRNGIRVVISDYNAAFQEWGGWERADRMIAEAEAARLKQRPSVPKQMSLFDMPGFMAEA